MLNKKQNLMILTSLLTISLSIFVLTIMDDRQNKLTNINLPVANLNNNLNTNTSAPVGNEDTNKVQHVKNVANGEIDTSDWILFNSHMDSGMKLNFSLKYPIDWFSKGSLDGGQSSVIPFYKKNKYSEDCNTVTKICTMKGQIAHINIISILNKNEIQNEIQNKNKYIVDGYEGYLDMGINKSGIIGIKYVSNDKIWLIIPDVQGVRFEFVMAIENENGKDIFYEILKNIKFIK